MDGRTNGRTDGRTDTSKGMDDWMARAAANLWCNKHHPASLSARHPRRADGRRAGERKKVKKSGYPRLPTAARGQPEKK